MTYFKVKPETIALTSHRSRSFYQRHGDADPPEAGRDREQKQLGLVRDDPVERETRWAVIDPGQR